MKQFKFDSWLNGDVTLIYSEVSYKENDKPIFVTWDDFDEADVIKIKQAQKSIFDDIVKQKLEILKSTFAERFNKSSMALELLETEKQECFNILFSSIPKTQIVFSKNWQISFEYNDVLEIQSYGKRTVLGGIDDGLDFIHSSNNRYQIRNKIPSQAYAQVLFSYYQWLEEEFSDFDESKKNLTTSKNMKIVELENPYPGIFRDGVAYKIFIELKEMTVNPDTQLANYSFIFHKMKNKNLIMRDTKHITFIKLLNDSFQADISVTKFPFKHQKTSLLVLKALLRKHNLDD